jgi:hypothetical protein
VTGLAVAAGVTEGEALRWALDPMTVSARARLALERVLAVLDV